MSHSFLVNSINHGQLDQPWSTWSTMVRLDQPWSTWSTMVNLTTHGSTCGPRGFFWVCPSTWNALPVPLRDFELSFRQLQAETSISFFHISVFLLSFLSITCHTAGACGIFNQPARSNMFWLIEKVREQCFSSRLPSNNELFQFIASSIKTGNRYCK